MEIVEVERKYPIDWELSDNIDNLKNYDSFDEFFKKNNLKLIETVKKAGEDIGYIVTHDDIPYFIKTEQYSKQLLKIFEKFDQDIILSKTNNVPYLYIAFSINEKRYTFYEIFSRTFQEEMNKTNYNLVKILEILCNVCTGLLYLFENKVLHNDLHIKNVMVKSLMISKNIMNIYNYKKNRFHIKSTYGSIVINDFGLSVQITKDITAVKKIYFSFLSRFFPVESLTIIHDDTIFDRIFYIDLWRILYGFISQLKNHIDDKNIFLYTIVSKYIKVCSDVLLYKKLFDYDSVVISLLNKLIFEFNVKTILMRYTDGHVFNITG